MLCKKLIKRYSGSGADVITDLNNLLYRIEQLPYYKFGSNMGIGLIPIEILRSLFKESNYLGLLKNNPKIKTLVDNVTNRIENYHTIKTDKINVFTKRGLMDFVKSKVVSDQVYCFREFTNDEIIATLKFMISIIESHGHIKIFLETDDYFISNLEFNYFKNHMLWFFDTVSGYSSDFYDVTIDAEPLVNMFDDFIINEIIPHHTLPESDVLSYDCNFFWCHHTQVCSCGNKTRGNLGL